MGRFILFFVFLLTSFFVNGQNISLEQLLVLRSKDFEYVDNYLISKQWLLKSSKKETDTSYAQITYSPSLIKSETITYITFYKIGSSLNSNRILFQFEDAEYYKSSNNRIVALGYKLLSNRIGDNKIVKVYQKRGVIVEFTALLSDNLFKNQTLYEIFIATLRDYYTNLKEEK